MADTISLSTVRTLVRQRTHYEQSQFVTDPELTQWINDSQRELYDLLIAAYEGYKVASVDNAISSGNTFSLPADFYKLQAVDRIVALPDQFETLRRVSFAERNNALRGYDLRGSTVYITPYSWAAGNTFRLWYTPTCPLLVADGDTFDAVDGWHEYVVADVCLKVCAKSGEDGSLFAAAKQATLDRVEAMARNRDENEPPHVTDVHGAGMYGTWIGGRYVTDLW